MHQQIPNGITENEVLVIAFEIDPIKESWTDYVTALPKNELDRAGEFHYLEDKLRFTKCRSVLRNTLSKWLNNNPEEIEITFGKNGKPYLKQTHGIEFSISHTKDFGGIAFSRHYEIGIDVENINRDTNIIQVAEKVFTDEERVMLHAEGDPIKRKIFFRLWTAKEALLKATGLGLSLDPKKINLNLPAKNEDHGTLECDHESCSTTLRFMELSCPEPYMMTLCTHEKALDNVKVFFL